MDKIFVSIPFHNDVLKEKSIPLENTALLNDSNATEDNLLLEVTCLARHVYSWLR